MGRLLERVEREWTGSDLELEIRAGLPGKFLRRARRGEGGGASQVWRRLRDYLDHLSRSTGPARAAPGW